VKYKGRYQCARHREYSIGRFYRSDLRKIASLQQHYKLMFPDSISHDPIRFLGKLMEDGSTLFYAVRNEKKVEGYGTSILLDSSRVVELHTFRKKLPFSLLKFRRFVEVQLEFAFEELQIRKIYARIPSKSRTFVSLVERIGFTVEAILRKDTMYNGKFVDMVILGMLKEEF
jgi:hypothetical protein